MKKSKEYKILEKVAKQNGVSIEEVIKEITLAIDIGMASADPAAQKHWADMPKKGEKPTPEEAISYLTKKIKSDMKG